DGVGAGDGDFHREIAIRGRVDGLQKAANFGLYLFGLTPFCLGALALLRPLLLGADALFFFALPLKLTLTGLLLALLIHALAFHLLLTLGLLLRLCGLALGSFHVFLGSALLGFLRFAQLHHSLVQASGDATDLVATLVGYVSSQIAGRHRLQ